MSFKGNLAKALADCIREADAGDLTEEEAGAIVAAMFEKAGTDSCFVKAAADEPIFVLRAQDATAPSIVAIWGIVARLVGTPEEKIRGAIEWSQDQAIPWQLANKTAKWPD